MIEIRTFQKWQIEWLLASLYHTMCVWAALIVVCCKVASSIIYIQQGKVRWLQLSSSLSFRECLCKQSQLVPGDYIAPCWTRHTAYRGGMSALPLRKRHHWRCKGESHANIANYRQMNNTDSMHTRNTKGRLHRIEPDLYYLHVLHACIWTTRGEWPPSTWHINC